MELEPPIGPFPGTGWQLQLENVSSRFPGEIDLNEATEFAQYIESARSIATFNGYVVLNPDGTVRELLPATLQAGVLHASIDTAPGPGGIMVDTRRDADTHLADKGFMGQLGMIQAGVTANPLGVNPADFPLDIRILKSPSTFVPSLAVDKEGRPILTHTQVNIMTDEPLYGSLPLLPYEAIRDRLAEIIKTEGLCAVSNPEIAKERSSFKSYRVGFTVEDLSGETSPEATYTLEICVSKGVPESGLSEIDLKALENSSFDLSDLGYIQIWLKVHDSALTVNENTSIDPLNPRITGDEIGIIAEDVATGEIVDVLIAGEKVADHIYTELAIKPASFEAHAGGRFPVEAGVVLGSMLLLCGVIGSLRLLNRRNKRKNAVGQSHQNQKKVKAAKRAAFVPTARPTASIDAYQTVLKPELQPEPLIVRAPVKVDFGNSLQGAEVEPLLGDFSAEELYNRLLEGTKPRIMLHERLRNQTKEIMPLLVTGLEASTTGEVRATISKLGMEKRAGVVKNSLTGQIQVIYELGKRSKTGEAEVTGNLRLTIDPTGEDNLAVDFLPAAEVKDSGKSQLEQQLEHLSVDDVKALRRHRRQVEVGNIEVNSQKVPISEMNAEFLLGMEELFRLVPENDFQGIKSELESMAAYIKNNSVAMRELQSQLAEKIESGELPVVITDIDRGLLQEWSHSIAKSLLKYIASDTWASADAHDAFTGRALIGINNYLKELSARYNSDELSVLVQTANKSHVTRRGARVQIVQASTGAANNSHRTLVVVVDQNNHNFAR